MSSHFEIFRHEDGSVYLELSEPLDDEEVVFLLDGNNAFSVDYRTRPESLTPVNLAAELRTIADRLEGGGRGNFSNASDTQGKMLPARRRIMRNLLLTHPDQVRGEFEVLSIRLARSNRDRSFPTHLRVDRIAAINWNEHRFQECLNFLDEGHEIPPVIACCYVLEKMRYYTLLDGDHWVCAARERGYGTVPAYVERVQPIDPSRYVLGREQLKARSLLQYKDNGSRELVAHIVAGSILETVLLMWGVAINENLA